MTSSSLSSLISPRVLAGPLKVSSAESSLLRFGRIPTFAVIADAALAATIVASLVLLEFVSPASFVFPGLRLSLPPVSLQIIRKIETSAQVHMTSVTDPLVLVAGVTIIRMLLLFFPRLPVSLVRSVETLAGGRVASGKSFPAFFFRKQLVISDRRRGMMSRCAWVRLLLGKS
jgi:hypothetical protein